MPNSTQQGKEVSNEGPTEQWALPSDILKGNSKTDYLEAMANAEFHLKEALNMLQDQLQHYDPKEIMDFLNKYRP